MRANDVVACVIRDSVKNIYVRLFFIIIMKQIEININGNIFIANLLEEKATRTCKALLEILPLELEGYHYFWSGEGIQIRDPALKGMANDAGLWPDPVWADTKENAKFNGIPGEVGFYARGGGINITYGQARFFGPPMGVEPNYIFAKIDDTKRLYTVGRTFRREGAQKISIKLVT